MKAIAKLSNQEATTLKAHVYTLCVNGVELNVENIFQFPATYNQEIRNRVFYELDVLLEKDDWAFKISSEEVSKILKDEVEINSWARRGAYCNNQGFGEWFENQCRNSLRWHGEDADAIRRILLTIISHMHGFYHDTTLSWEEAQRNERKTNIFINKLSKVFAVA